MASDSGKALINKMKTLTLSFAFICFKKEKDGDIFWWAVFIVYYFPMPSKNLQKEAFLRKLIPQWDESHDILIPRLTG